MKQTTFDEFVELARRGIGRHCVALDPGGFRSGLETRWFHWTLASSVRLVGLVRPLHPTLSRHAITRTLLLPDRRGNNRTDSLRNVIADPRVASARSNQTDVLNVQTQQPYGG